MTRRLVRLFAFMVVSGALVFTASSYLYGQDSSQATPEKPASAKSKKTSESENKKAAQHGPGAKGEANGEKSQAAGTDEAKKKDDTPPPPPGPKLIEVPQDNTTYAPRPKVVAVFVFTNGNRIESDDYLITKDAVFINKDGQKTRYPINTIDRAATNAANQERGVEIVFPKSRSEFNLDF
jgi:hypothetical protein